MSNIQINEISKSFYLVILKLYKYFITSIFLIPLSGAIDFIPILSLPIFLYYYYYFYCNFINIKSNHTTTLFMSSPSQLFSCVDANAILKSPVNTSTAKHHWSFSKSDRFPNSKLYCDAMYDLPTTKSKRKTAFGYGKKTDLQIGKHRHNIIPSPDTYKLNTFIQTNKLHNKGFSPGKSRDEVAPVSYIPLEPFKMPGPGTYSPGKSRDTPYWSMRPRTSSECKIFPKTTQKLVPGPGRYQSCQNLSSSGKYFTTKHSNSKSKVWNPKCSKRFYKSTSDAPGPGTYNPLNDLSAEGDYVLSNNPSAGHRKLLLGSRDSFVDEDHKRILTPGPGTYRLPSDFGQYDEPISARSSILGKTTARSKFIK